MTNPIPKVALGVVLDDGSGEALAEHMNRKTWDLACEEAKKQNKPCPAYKSLNTIQGEQLLAAALIPPKIVVSAVKKFWNFASAAASNIHANTSTSAINHSTLK